MKELYAAMAKAFASIEGATKDSNNPHFKSKYADLGAVVNAIKPALVSNGLWFAQVNHEQSGGVCVETILCHASGDQMSFGKLFVPASKNDAQGYGSALTYARRYSLLTAFGVCPEDDDGNAATAAPPKAEALINDDQRLELMSLIDATGANIAKFCTFYKIKALPEMPLANFDHARAQLLGKLPQEKAA